MLAASEDKTYRGASIAAPNMAWIWGTLTLEPERRFSGPYHLVWPRDLYHVATAQKAAGDDAAADRLLDYLWRVQKPAGDWWQNTFVDGREKWTTEQLDQVSLPIVLAWWLGRTGATDWAHVERAADYLVNNEDRPRSNQERWENQDGYSPNTIATEIAGLICAADIARKNGADGKAAVVRGARRRVAAEGGELDRDDERPVLAEAVLRARTKDGRPERRQHLQPGRQFRPPGRRARDRRQLVPRPGAVRRQEMERPDDPQLARRRRRQRDDPLPAEGQHAERPGLAPVQLRRLRRAGSTGTIGTCSSTTRRGRRAGAYGRCSPASAASTS